MASITELTSYEYIIPISLILMVFLPMVPNNKLRYYACYICYVTVVSITAVLLAPIVIMRPRNVVNMKIAGNIIKHFTKILGIQWELRNGYILKKEQGTVIVANHQSILDIMGMFNIWDVMDKCTAVAKRELLYIPPFGPMAWLGGLVFIDRVDPKSANKQLSAAAEVLHNKKVKLWLFPEGTRNKKGDCILPFKRGAFRVAIETKVPIIPLVYSPYYFIDSKNKTFSEGKIIISVLEPISTEGLTINDIDMLKDKTHKLMSEEYKKLHRDIDVFQKMSLKNN